MATDLPEVRQGLTEPEADLRLVLLDRELQRRAQVVVLGRQPIQPGPLLRTPQLRPRTLRHHQVMPRMSPSYAHPLTAFFEPFQRVLPDCLEHPEVGLALRVFAASDQVLGDERLQAVQKVNVEAARITEIADRLGGLHYPSA